ncbi:hypothetical protein BRD04_01395 [Halobacteriales archaeon QS_9_67_17]|nr:MAG: hypothetical protein BRD04_01395 [Halobacteriales archaeon QS_9_67_17]
MKPEHRFLGVAFALTFVTAVTSAAVGVAANMSFGPIPGGHYYLTPDGSDAAARFAAQFGQVASVALLASIALVPLAVGGYRLLAGDDRVRTAALLTAALATVPGLPVGVLWTTSYPPAITPFEVAAALLAVIATALAVAHRRAGVAGLRRLAPAQFAHVAVGILVVVGIGTGAAVGAGLQGSVVDTNQLRAPQVAFDGNYTAVDGDRGVVTIRHDGGDDVAVDRLVLTGEGFADVDDAEQVEPGPWQGSVSTGPDGTTVVSPGDTVTVGVEGDCRIRLVHERPTLDRRHTIGLIDCAELRGEA